MVLQRWQSLLLFVAVILMACFMLSPMAVVGTTGLMPMDYIFIWVPAVAAALLLLIDIFMFKNLKLQMKVAAVCLLVMLAVGISSAVVIIRTPEAEISWMGALLYLVCAFVLTIRARLLMGKDLRLLRSVDRLR